MSSTPFSVYRAVRLPQHPCNVALHTLLSCPLSCSFSAGFGRETDEKIGGANPPVFDISLIEIGGPDSGKSPYGPFDTIELSGGYRVVAALEPDDSAGVPFERFTLRRDTMIADLGGWSEGLLRYDVTDAGKYFLFFQNTRGPGNPRYFDLIVKRTGASLLSGVFIDLDSSGRYLLYESPDSSGREKRMAFFDMDSARREVCEYPSDLLSVSPTYGITLKSVDRDRFVIEYRTEDRSHRLREYRRGDREHGKE